MSGEIHKSGLPSAGLSRRAFLANAAAVAGAAGLAGVLPESLARAATPSPQKFELSKVKHLVFLMQENRSFDHYFGTFPGARGFNDPTALRLPTGHTVFQQPDPANPDGYQEPYHMSTITTGAAAVPSLSHAWSVQHAAWNGGKMDNWVPAHVAADGNRKGPFTMGYYTEEDIPFHWALAKAFTLCDNYHCSVMGPTTPNRLFMESGGIDQQGVAGGPILDTAYPPPLSYEPGPTTLYNAGISFKYYGAPGWGIAGNTNAFVGFRNGPGEVPDALYHGIQSDGTLWGDGTPGGIGDPANPTPASDPNLAFEEDCANGVLPDVAYIGSAADEHPPNIPAAGAQFIASKLEALAANEELWNSTVFVLNYDENDGFFDHVPPPVPDRMKYPEEFVTKNSPLGTLGDDLPVGAGFRVPCIVISPWSTGGRIFSEVSDHTSCLRLIETVAAAGGLSGKGPITFPNLTRWRRATFSDMTGALRPGAGQPAPTSPEFAPATTAANLAAQTAASRQPMPALPDVGEPVSLTISPAAELVLAGGASTIVRATFSNNGPAAVSDVRLALTVPSGWTASQIGTTPSREMPAHSSRTASWQVTAPPGSGSQVASASGTASWTEHGTGAKRTITAQQAPPPVITSASPTTVADGDIVTITGTNFGASQGAGYLTLSDNGVNWGTPGASATFVLDSWSDTKITFTVPSPSGTNGKWRVIPGSTATVTVSTNGGTSAPANLHITAAQGPAPVITSVSPATAGAGDVVTITGTNFGALQAGGYVVFSDYGVNWGAPGASATFVLDSWSDTKITFTVPSPSGTNGKWRVVPGSTATVTVTNNTGKASTPVDLLIATTGPTPVISSVTPATAGAGDVVTITGSNFGASLIDKVTFVEFTDGTVRWGVPNAGATFALNSWSDTTITFTCPEPSGSGGTYHVIPGSTATIRVATPGGLSNTVPLAIA